ncbi:hypothetical protein ACGFNU_01810 [Spirillospora sp. NPDC048911]|uniref:hypothetical protein n=1 Tax=Spirillospora sp. NPDC048911 TaxID=3364527 RepID=UPI0037238F00
MNASDDPSLGELARTLARVESFMRERFAELGNRLDRMVTAELYAATQQTVQQQMDALREDVEELKAARRRDEDRRSADRRLALYSAVVPALLLTVNLVVVLVSR